MADYLYTSPSLSGAGCQVVFEKLCELGSSNPTVRIVNQVPLSEIEELSDKLDESAILCITDLDLPTSGLDVIDKLPCHKIYASRTPKHVKADFAYTHPKVSPSKLYLEAVQRIYDDPKILNEYKPFVDAINDHDLLVRDSEHGSLISDLYYALGRDAFIYRFVNDPSLKLTDFESKILANYRARRSKYLEKVALSAIRIDLTKIPQGSKIKYKEDKAKVGCIFIAEDFISSACGHMLYTTDSSVVIAVNPQLERVSMRAVQGIDLTEYVRHYGGGGYPTAAGFPCNFTLQYLAEVVNAAGITE